MKDGSNFMYSITDDVFEEWMDILERMVDQHKPEFSADFIEGMSLMASLVRNLMEEQWPVELKRRKQEKRPHLRLAPPLVVSMKDLQNPDLSMKQILHKARMERNGKNSENSS
jgi:hypothetical protein